MRRVFPDFHDNHTIDDIDGTGGWPFGHEYSAFGNGEHFFVGSLPEIKMAHAAPQAHHPARASPVRFVKTTSR
jgi:hypothetical protein